MKLHTIRLGEPWERTDVGDGRTRHRRRFGRPRTLDATERLSLSCEHLPGPSTIFVNGEKIAERSAGHGYVFDLTEHLRPRNELVIEVASPEPLGTVLLEVWTVPSPS
ncbi:MAG: hypothetical protein ABGY75_13030 [Gemmataceae bacterium]